MMDLAIFPNLNLAACCLKVRDFRTVVTFCTYVLEFDANNIKAYYQRVVTSLQLNLLDDAFKDLTKGVCLDPSIPDVLKELKNVERFLGSAHGSLHKGKVVEPSMDIDSASTSSESLCATPMDIGDGNQAIGVPIEDVTHLRGNLGFE